MTGAAPTVLVPLDGRDGLPFVDLHRQPLYLHAVRTATDVTGREVLVGAAGGDRDRVEQELRRARLSARAVPAEELWAGPWAERVLVHDPLCPLVPAAFLREVLERAAGDPAAGYAAYRPVTDTVKTAVAERIQGTIDRERLGVVTSPVVLGAVAAATVVDPPGLSDLAALVGWLRGRVRVELVRAPSLGRRVEDASSVVLLECVDELAHQVRG